MYYIKGKTLFECSRIRINPYVIVVDWSGTWIKFHPNPLQQMWIEMNPTSLNKT